MNHNPNLDNTNDSYAKYRQGKILGDETKAAFIAEIKTGKPFPVIAKAFGVSVTTVWRWKHKL